MKKIITITSVLALCSIALAANNGYHQGMSPTQTTYSTHFRAGLGIDTSGYVQGELGMMFPIQYFDITPAMIISSEGGGFSLDVMHPIAASNNSVSVGGYLNCVGNNFGIGPSVEFNFIPSITIGATLLLGDNQGGLFSAWYNF
ncbi:MAG: hypothetical protein NTX05_05805 [Fusobacteria bacterium]|nr:hypothetical protein [Fusobacteriota bacterium]